MADRLLLFFLLLLCSDTGFWLCACQSAPICNSSIAECNVDEEMLMASEAARRFLEEKKYISVGALKRDQPVCNGGSGEAYSKSCVPQSSNPHDRGCSKYYRCRSDSK